MNSMSKLDLKDKTIKILLNQENPLLSRVE